MRGQNPNPKRRVRRTRIHQALLGLSFLSSGLHTGCGSNADQYYFHEFVWSDTDESIAAIMSTTPPSGDGPGSLVLPERIDLVLAPADDLGAHESILELHFGAGYQELRFMQSAGYLSFTQSAPSMLGFLVYLDNPASPIEVEPPGQSCFLDAFLPSPDGGLIAVTQWCSTSEDRLDIYEVQSGTFVASWTGLEFANEGVAPNYLRWTAAGDLVASTQSGNVSWFRFDAGLQDPVAVGPIDCYDSPATTSGEVNSAGVGLCGEMGLKTCELENDEDDPLQPFGCP